VSGTVLVVHGHFYQPPRENPWTEEVPHEAEAAPFHDWNERINAECYRANAFARVVDTHGRVVAVVNSYEHMSFDVGPTLMAWLEAHAPDTYERIVAADGAGGGALAHPYYHVILPLADERDARTNIRWGLADFRHRFGREPDGMWLPETAVSPRVLELLAEEGVRFTILGPHQAAAPVDPRRPYRARGVAVVFFDPALSHAVAFESPSSQALVDRVAAAGGEGGVVCVATDGESFGHHHRYADRALAYALTVEAPRRGIAVTNVARCVSDHPPAEEVDVVVSSWSCAHGVARWREDCGCATGGEPGWNQAWRAPLRRALDLLRDVAAEVHERRGGAVLTDPWAARDAYVDVLLGRLDQRSFVAAHARPGADPVEVLTLLEVQRHVLAMYTSCGWFFNDLSGIETVYVLRLAARAMDLLAELGERPPLDAFLAVLGEARSNDPDEGDGRRVWERHVVPYRVDARRVVAHLALVELLGQPRPEGVLAGFDVDWARHDHQSRGSIALCAGRVRLVHRRTLRASDHVYAAVHLGGLEVFGALRPARGAEPVLDEVGAAFAEGEPVTAVLRRIGEHFGPEEFDLSWALPEAAGQILDRVAGELTDRFAAAFERLFADHRHTLDALAAAGYPLRPELRAPVELVLRRRLEAELERAAEVDGGEAYRGAEEVARLARSYGVRVDTPEAHALLTRAIGATVDRAVSATAGPGAAAAAETALALLRLARALGVHPDLQRAQELVYGALVDGGDPGLRLLGAALGLAVEDVGRPG
jgi:alpha-amylase/alpha-mannosidase (GH57 family)